MTSLPHCICCDQLLVDAFDGWCAACAGAILADVMALRDSADLSVIVCVLRDAGAMALAKCVVGVVPFVDSPPYEILNQ